MSKRVIGLDVGTYSVKVAHLQSRNRGTDFEVVAYAEKLLSDFHFEEQEGAFPVQWRQQQAALLHLKAQGFFEEGTNITSGLSGMDAQVRSLVVPFTNAKKIQSILGGLLDAQLPLDIDDLVLSWFLQESVKGEKVEAGAEVQNQILVAFAKKNSMETYLNLLGSAGINPRYITHKAAGLFDLLQYFINQYSLDANKPVVVIDIGFRSTSICIGSGNRLLSARTMLRGGFDITQMLMSKFDLSFADAEKRKIETGFIETETEKAKLLEQHLTSEALKESYLPIIRELKQTLLALQSQGQPECSQIFLVGGASGVRNLDKYFHEMLHIRTQAENNSKITVAADVKMECPLDHSPQKAEAALAMSYAIFGHTFSKKRKHFDLRKGDFAWRGELNFLRSHSRILMLWTLIVFILLLGYGSLKNSLTNRELDALKAREMAACESVLGKKIESGGRCLSLIQEQILGQGQSGVPEKSASDVYLEISKAISPQIQVKLTELDIAEAKLRVNGETSGFEAVDAIYAALLKVPCVFNVEKGRARQTDEAVHFQMTADFNCQAPDAATAKRKVNKRKR